MLMGVRMHMPDQKDLRRERELSGHPLYAREAETVARFVDALRTAEVPADFRELHRDLLGRFIGCQRFLEQLARNKERVKAAIRTAKTEVRDGVVRALSRDIKRIDFDEHAAKAAMSIYRTLGDALVWTLLGYQRTAITVLGEGERVDRLATGDGLHAELDLIEKLWEEDGIVAVHTDITTCMRHGDVLSIEQRAPLRIGLEEVKAGREPFPGSPQMTRLERVKTLINRGYHPTAANGEPIIIEHSPVRFRTHQALLPTLLEQARRETYVSVELEDGLLIEVYDETNPAGLPPPQIDQRAQGAHDETGWWEDERDLLRYSISSRRLRERLHSFSSLAPVALFPLPVEDVAGLVIGRYDVIATLNASLLEEHLAETGIGAVVARGDAAGDSFLEAGRGNARITVPAPVREQILIELMTLGSLFAMVRWLLDQSEKRGSSQPAIVVGYAGEAEHWASHE
jgi:hypothetical protein